MVASRARFPGTVLVALLLAATPLPAPASDPLRPRLIVELALDARPEGGLANLEQVRTQRLSIAEAQLELYHSLERDGIDLHRAYETLPYLALDVPLAALPRLAASPWVKSIAGDELAAPDIVDSVPLVGAPVAWSLGIDGADTTIAVLDTGVDAAHEFFEGRVIREACFSLLGQCPGGQSAADGPGAAAPCRSANGCYHGTHVAGIAAGHIVEGGAEAGGVAPGANLFAVQVFSVLTGSVCGGAADCALSYSSDQIAALEYLALEGPAVGLAAVNMSLGGGGYASAEDCDYENPGRRAAIESLRALGIATVISAGNEGLRGELAAPGCLSAAISVGATDKAGVAAPYSNSAKFLKLLAPGSHIISSVPGGYAYLSGTSMAAPHVAGAFALLRQRAPGATVHTLYSQLKKTGKSTRDQKTGYSTRRIRVDRAIEGFGDPPPALELLRPKEAGRARPELDLSIKWKPTGTIELFDVYVSSDRSLSWQKIGSRVAGRKLVWTTPATAVPLAGYRFRVDAVTPTGEILASDESLADFSIVPQ